VATYVKVQHHIGGAHYVSVTTGYNCVDLQKFDQPYNSKDRQIKATKRLPKFVKFFSESSFEDLEKKT